MKIHSILSNIMLIFASLVCLLGVRGVQAEVSLYPSGTLLVQFNSPVRITCVISKNQGLAANWAINGQVYYSVNHLPSGFQHSFTNSTASQLLINDFTQDFDSSSISCFVTVDGREMHSPTLHIMGIDALPTSTTSSSTTTATTVHHTSSSPSPSPSVGSVPPSVTDSIESSTLPTSAGLKLSVSWIVLSVALLSALLYTVDLGLL